MSRAARLGALWSVAEEEIIFPISDLQIGDKIKFGSIYSEPIIWLVADKNHSGYPANSVTLISEKIIKFMAFDGAEPSNSDDNRKTGGNNRYRYSNIRIWLNSDQAAGLWYSAQHAADAPPSATNVDYNPYDTQSGFLNAFTADEKNAILTSSITCARSSVDGGGSESVSHKVFLISRTESGLSGSPTEGSILSLFTSDNSSRLCYPTQTAINNSQYKSGLSTTKPAVWRLRTPQTDLSFAHYTYNASASGAASLTSAHNGSSGLRPALNLSSSLLTSSKKDSDGCYNIIF